jgi:UDP-glucose 4-epimerase
MEKYLVTGGDGFIGSKLAEYIGGISFDVKSGNDILDKNKLSEACNGVSGIYHCAAKISVTESIQKPDEYYENNVRGTINVIEAATAINSKIVFSSSAAVYGEASNLTKENSLLKPLSPYAENKYECESLLINSVIPNVILRYFNVFGPGQSDAYAGVISIFIKNALRNEDIVVFGDGNQIRDFIYVDDVIQANTKAMNTTFDKTEIFNIGSGIKTSITELAEMIIALTNSSSKLIKKPSRPGDIQFSQADISKAKDLLNWKPQVSLQDGLGKTIEFYRDK